MKEFLKRIFAPTILVAWTVYYYLDVLDKDAKTGALIKPLSVVIFFLYVIIMIGEVRRYLKTKKNTEDKDKAKQDKKRFINLLICIGITAAYILLMPYLGFVIATSVFMSAMYLYVKAGKKLYVCIASVVFSILVFLLFSKVLAVPLPTNMFGF